jgi:hypothetical protein
MLPKTIEDAIQGRIRHHQVQISQTHAKPFNDEKQIWIDTLRFAPTDLQML